MWITLTSQKILDDTKNNIAIIANTWGGWFRQKPGDFSVFPSFEARGRDCWPPSPRFSDDSVDLSCGLEGAVVYGFWDTTQNQPWNQHESTIYNMSLYYTYSYICTVITHIPILVCLSPSQQREPPDVCCRGSFLYLSNTATGHDTPLENWRMHWMREFKSFGVFMLEEDCVFGFSPKDARGTSMLYDCHVRLPCF